MENKDIRKHAWATYKETPVANWVLGLTTGLIVAAFIAIDLAVNGISFVLFPFLILPILFSATISHVMIKTNHTVTFGSSIKAFGTYYQGTFFGCFSVIRSILKSLLIFLITEMTMSFVVSSILYATNSDFINAMNEFYKIMEENALTLDTFQNLFYMYDGILFTYICVVAFPSIYIAIMFFIYNLSRNSITIYYRMHSRNTNARYNRLVYSDVLRYQRGPMLKAYLSLNWPLFVLLAFGLAGGTVLGYFWSPDLLTMFSCGILGGAVLSMFFLPFYFSNQEALYDSFIFQFKESTSNIAKLLMETLQENIDLSMEQKEELEKSLQIEDEPEDAEDNKKDPDGP